MPSSMEIYGGVREIFSSRSGISAKNVELFNKYPEIITGDPHINSGDNEYTNSWKKTEEIRVPQGDFNQKKYTLREINVKNDSISIATGLTDYFTIWGLSQTNSELHNKAIKQIGSRGKTNIPIAISTHNILLSSEGVLARVSSKAAGFSAGRVSISFEEQAEPTLDSNIVNAAFRGYQEELGILISPEKILLLGIGLEISTAYVCFCHIARTDFSKKAIENASDKSETEAFFTIPLNEIDIWSSNEIKPDIWRKYTDKQCPIDHKAILKTHPTVSWRIKLLKNFLSG